MDTVKKNHNSSDKKPRKKVRLRKARVVEFSVAVGLTVLLIAIAPVFGWFANQRRIAKLAKIKAPDELYINAAHREDKVYLDMKSIEVARQWNDGGTMRPISSQSFVFSVSGEWVNSFLLQMEHTTNNPYTFEIFEGTIYKKTGNDYINIISGASINSEHPDYTERNADGSLKYVEYTATGIYDAAEMEKVTFDDDGVRADDNLIIYIESPVTGSYLNPGSGRIADNSKTEKSYGTYTNINQYVNPKYWQSARISVRGDKGSPFYKTYVIKVSWDPNENMKKYNKETDIVYLSAFVD